MACTLPGIQVSKTEEAGVQAGTPGYTCEAYTVLGTLKVLQVCLFKRVASVL